MTIQHRGVHWWPADIRVNWAPQSPSSLRALVLVIPPAAPYHEIYFKNLHYIEVQRCRSEISWGERLRDLCPFRMIACLMPKKNCEYVRLYAMRWWVKLVKCYVEIFSRALLSMRVRDGSIRSIPESVTLRTVQLIHSLFPWIRVQHNPVT